MVALPIWRADIELAATVGLTLDPQAPGRRPRRPGWPS